MSTTYRATYRTERRINGRGEEYYISEPYDCCDSCFEDCSDESRALFGLSACTLFGIVMFVLAITTGEEAWYIAMWGGLLALCLSPWICAICCAYAQYNQADNTTTAVHTAEGAETGETVRAEEGRVGKEESATKKDTPTEDSSSSSKESDSPKSPGQPAGSRNTPAPAYSNGDKSHTNSSDQEFKIGDRVRISGLNTALDGLHGTIVGLRDEASGYFPVCVDSTDESEGSIVHLSMQNIQKKKNKK